MLRTNRFATNDPDGHPLHAAGEGGEWIQTGGVHNNHPLPRQIPLDPGANHTIERQQGVRDGLGEKSLAQRG